MTGSAKCVLLSILIMSVLIPARAAAHPDPREGFRQAIRQMAWFNLFYVLAVCFLYPRLL